MSIDSRPLSPHLQIYRWQITMLLSILHRASGVLLSAGAFALTFWLLALAGGSDAYAASMAVAGSLPGRIALFAFSAALIYHLLNGIRHLLWDIGWGFEIPQVYASGYAVVVLTLILTAALWWAAGVAA